MTEPIRLKILTSMSDDRQLSAKDFHDMLVAGKVDLGGWSPEITGVSYHLRVLEECGAVEVVRRVPVRGASKKVTKATAVGKELCLVWADLLRIADGDDGFDPRGTSFLGQRREAGVTVEDQSPQFDWAFLVPRTVHPMQVAIVEAISYVGLPLSAADLRRKFGEGHTVSHVSYHVNSLARVGALVLAEEQRHRGRFASYYEIPVGLLRA